MTGESGASTTILEIDGPIHLSPMNDGNRPQVTDEVVEFQK
jgi:hypothetical protein